MASAVGSKEVQRLQLYCPRECHLPSSTVLMLLCLGLCTFIKRLVFFLACVFPSFLHFLPLFLRVLIHLYRGTVTCEGVRCRLK